MFVKLFTQILDSSIADDRRLRHFFTDLLLCCDGEGFVMMTPQALARRIGAPIEEVLWGIGELLKPDTRSKTPDNEGRRIEVVEGSGYGWHVLNYEHYRAMKDANQLRESVKIRVQRHRAKKAGKITAVGCNGVVTHGNASNSMQKENAETEGEVESKAVNWSPSADQKIVNGFFRRRDSTKWDRNEIAAWKRLQPIDQDDFEVLGRFYTGPQKPGQFRRTTHVTLFNHWQGEIDKARAYTQNPNPPTGYANGAHKPAVDAKPAQGGLW